MASSTITGVGSGFDTIGIVKALVDAEKAPKQSQITAQQKDTTIQLSAVGTVKASLETYRAAIAKLNSVSSFNGLTASSTDEKISKVTIDDKASSGKYALDVATPEGFHTFTLEMKADGFTYRDSLTIQSVAPLVLPAKDLVILMYHQLVPGTATSEYTRSVTDFENDLIYLRDNGYAIISLEELLEIQKGEKPMPEGKLVTISFDDGAENVYSLAYPLLKAHGAKATFFVNPGSIGTAGKMTWANLREMAAWRDAEGERLISVNSHSLNHVALKKAELDFPGDAAGYMAFLSTQMGQSKAAIERNIPAADRGPLFLALPYGDGSGDPVIINMAKSLGYKGIRTSDALARNISSNKNFALPSVVVANTTAIAGIANYYHNP